MIVNHRKDGILTLGSDTDGDGLPMVLKHNVENGRIRHRREAFRVRIFRPIERQYPT